MKVKIELSTEQEILLKRNLNKDGKAQQMFTKECAKAMNPYIPFKTGTLKDLDVVVGTDNVTYYAPYARKQYFTNAGLGIEGNSLGGLRGKQWDKRMWSNHGNGIVKTIADFVGGKSE